MSDLYTSSLRERALVSARAHHIELASGVYVATRGPQLETPAEIRSFQAMGANVVGMSMVQEAIALGMLGAGVLGLCAVTNPAAGLSAGGLSTGSFLEVAASTLPKLRILLDDVLK
jgi:purine nucleoside phosphorylase